MSKSRLTLAAIAVVAATMFPASGAFAADDLTETVREIAADAADLAGQEQALLSIAGPGSDLPVAELDAARTRLQSVDAQGARALEQLTRLNVELTDAIRVVLDRLPPPQENPSPEFSRGLPPEVVYDAAIEDLLRISATPNSVMPSTVADRRPAVGLLIVAALALLTLGVFALANSLRRHPAGDDLAAMAWSDGLTGLANRRRLDHDLKSGDHRRGKTAVIMVDVDHFKSVNDSFGHQKGDEVLRTIGTMLVDQIRFDDVVYRYGGEEFCILLPDASTDDARRVADRIVRSARQIRLPDGEHVTVSVGVSTSIEGDVSSAVQSADRALYEAKDLGRDQAVTADQARYVSA